jgi:hypothetical protein
MSDDKKLTEEEEALLREFEEDRKIARGNVAQEVHQELKEAIEEQVKEVMAREVQGGMEAEVKKEVEMAMDIAVEKAVSREEMQKQMEADLRAKIEQETRASLQKEIEEKVRKEVEEREKQRKEELLKKIQGLKQLEDEIKVEKEKESRERQELQKRLQEIENSTGNVKQMDETELKEKLREELRKEMEEERQKKKEALLLKLENTKQAAAASQPKGLDHNEKVVILQLFEEAQLVMSTFLSTRLSKKDVEAMYVNSLMTGQNKYPDVLKRVMYDKTGNPTQGGAINASRILANADMLPVTEEKKSARFFEALRYVFDERVIAMEAATSYDIKNSIISDVLNQMKKSITKKGYNPKIESIFIKQVFPSTTLNQGG